MSKIAGIYWDDTAAAPGISLSVYFSGCHFHCPGCHNPEAQDFNYGQELNDEIIKEILVKMNKNGVERRLSILGGEPLDTEQKRDFLRELIIRVRYYYPEIKIVLWTGYKYNDIKDKEDFKYILENIDYLIDGPFILKERDITLKWRGSRNQNIRDMKTGEIIND